MYVLAVYFVALMLFALAGIFPDAAHPQEPGKIRVAITSPGMTNLSLYVANRQGFFKEQKIFNEIVVMRSAARQIQALIAASVEFSAQAPDPLIRAVERGADLVMLSGMANSPAYDLVAGKKYGKIEDLRGSTLGVSGINSSSTLLLQRMLAAHGLMPPRDYTLVEVGGTADRLIAIQTGAIAAGVLNPPISYVAADQGFKILGEVKQYIPEVQFTALSARRGWVLQNQQLAESYLAAVLKANAFIYDNKLGTIAVIREVFKVQPEYAERVYDYWVRNRVTPRDGGMTVAGTEVVLDILQQLGDYQGKTRPKAAKFIDTQLLSRAHARR
jgi:ABC-type nitrate/sulfonate/bicarbonate transport system substrate-binding protein